MTAPEAPGDQVPESAEAIEAEARASRLKRATELAKTKGAAANEWIVNNRDQYTLIDLGTRWFERDREIGGTTLASALAFRLFLFFMPMVLFIVAALGFLFEPKQQSPDALIRKGGMFGVLAGQIRHALEGSHGFTRLLVMVVALVTVLHTGNSLIKVLIDIRSRAWGIPRKLTQPRIRASLILIGLFGASLIISTIIARLRNAAGVPGSVGLFVVAGILYMVFGMALAWYLPRGADSWLAIVPGALITGVSLATLQAFTQLYLPDRLSSMSAKYGPLGAGLAMLAYMFFLTRALVMSASLDAVVWEQHEGPADLVLKLVRLRPTKKRAVPPDGPAASDETEEPLEEQP